MFSNVTPKSAKSPSGPEVLLLAEIHNMPSDGVCACGLGLRFTPRAGLVCILGGDL